MQIFFKGPTGKSYTLEVEPSDLVENVRTQIEDKSGIACGKQRIIFGGKQLENGHTLAEYGVREDSNLGVVIRMGGPGNCPGCGPKRDQKTTG